MHGDLSTPFTTRDINFAGILEQQGRVSLDADANAATAIALAWQDTEASDVIGSGVAAVPADAPNSFFVTKAAVDVAGNVLITVSGGRVWVDGILVQLEGTAPITRKATYPSRRWLRRRPRSLPTRATRSCSRYTVKL